LVEAVNAHGSPGAPKARLRESLHSFISLMERRSNGRTLLQAENPR
jgi:hypothetical protein